MSVTRLQVTDLYFILPDTKIIVGVGENSAAKNRYVIRP